ncbi:hypothetical protein Q4512_00075 [Oceanihabitans sp. 2_MG-2023]|uniref:DUF6695 family protein n=1 Tax=Oceanihabitans sp. 2_MG-2023 TaxID=3062661 RepID=UPI0026E2CA96|nr:DUF6695 family protein [Oceanihabitans sp. 2_MG-2023]MDO6595286.1 hypothetical protein [Oceanihabitans sp. 2_MG-2023]
MNNTAIILTLAYPETIVMVADEWYSPYLRFLGVGKKNYLRAGHAALVLIEKATGILEYHDFGRYITPEPNGRVRGKDTDHELCFPVVAKFENDKIENLNEILEFLATHPKLTHGDGKLIASVCNAVDYYSARQHITMMQQRDFIRYAAFIKEACNCARFVTDALIVSVTDKLIKDKLEKSKWFTPSTIGNVVIADTENMVYEVSETGEISEYKSTVSKDNRLYFLDRLKNHVPSFVGTLKPKPVENLHENAQWLSGIAAGAWYELHATENRLEYWYKRISPYGNIDVHALYKVTKAGFNYQEAFEFIHYSNCKFFHVKQKETVYKFEIKEI